jgi:hypothetical protein
MGGALERVGENRVVYRNLLGELRETNHLGDKDLDGKEVRCGVMNWIQLAQDGGRWRALVNEVMNFQVP